MSSAPASDAAVLRDRVFAMHRSPPRAWRLLFAGAALLALAFVAALVWSVVGGPGVWGNNIPVGWAVPIVSYGWWQGIGHSATLIAALLVLARTRWSAPVHRVAETTAVAGLAIGGIFPILHLGRQWFFYWVIPYPPRFEVWPQYLSTLSWDLLALTSYLVLSVLFWYVGLIPDLATMRDSAPKRRRLYGLLSLGWLGAAREWRHLQTTRYVLAALIVPLVVLGRGIVALNFATTVEPGWHLTILPLHYVATGVYGGLGLLLVLVVVLRRAYRLHDVIRRADVDRLALMLLAAAWVLIYCYALEILMPWLARDPYAQYLFFIDRPGGPFAFVVWTMLIVNIVAPQLFWSRRLRRSSAALVAVGGLAMLGSAAERVVVIINTESRGFLPSSWAGFTPTLTDLGLLLGGIGAFGVLFLVLLRLVPIVPLGDIVGYPTEPEADRT